MPIFARFPARVLSAQVIPAADENLRRYYKLLDNQRSISFFTCDFDDVGYVACDEATKMADVDVVYAASFYAGAGNASSPTAGEFIGILAAETPADALAGLRAAAGYIEAGGSFRSADEDGKILFFAENITSVGTYLSAEAGIPVGSALGYMIAPPAEATFGLDAALKSADVSLVKYFAPPSPTNFSGGWVKGTQAACQAAVDAFAAAVAGMARCPLEPFLSGFMKTLG